jgi:anaerobic ribonucleoside-triphosphate reductase
VESAARHPVALLGLDEMVFHHLGVRMGAHPEAENAARDALRVLGEECGRYGAMHSREFLLEASGDTRLAIQLAAHDRRHFVLDDTAPGHYTPAGYIKSKRAGNALESVVAESVFHRSLPGGAVTVLDAAELPEDFASRLDLLRRVHSTTECQGLAVRVDLTICRACGVVARRQQDICERCASSRVLGISRLLGPLEVLPRWSGPYQAVVDA